MKFFNTLLGIALAGVFALSASHQAQATIITWDLLDHGDGQLGPFYGLRLDDPLATNTAGPGPDDNKSRLFSFGGASTAVLKFDTVLETASISGTIVENGFGGTAACAGGVAHSPGDCSIWDLAYDLTGVVVDPSGDPFEGFTATGGSGSVSLGTLTLELGAKKSGAFSFLWLPDGHRLDNDNSTLVGRGWVDPESTSSGANDFLFQGVLVPEPGAFALLGVGLLGLGVLRRRKIRA